jgi:hypothetical protein
MTSRDVTPPGASRLRRGPVGALTIGPSACTGAGEQ